ncbi:restriction endonuclease [bacterium]|nr:restriction endonuclease [bacterium]
MEKLSLRKAFKDWQHFEEYVYDLLEAAKPALESRGIEVYKHKTFQGTKGKWEVDVAYEFDILGVRHLVLVECKYYSRKITREKVAHFLASIADLAASKGIIVSNQNFTAGAQELANGTQVQLLRLDEFHQVIEDDLAQALRKELFKKIIDMRDEVIFVSKRYGFERIYGRFWQIQSILSEYVDFPERFPLPLKFLIQDLKNDNSTEKMIYSRIEYLITILNNISLVRDDFKKVADLADCEYTQEL